jgi:TolB-like protein
MLLAGALALLLSGCGLRPPVVMKQASLPDDGNICRVAVLPFANQSGYPLGDTIFYRIFVAELLENGNYLVSQEGDVRKIYRQMRVLVGQVPDIEQVRALAGRLGAQVVISGTVLEMRDKPQYSRRLDPSIAVVVRIMDGETGRTLWTTFVRREGTDYRKVMHFGVVNTVSALAKRVSKEMLAAWLKEGLHKCNE